MSSTLATQSRSASFIASLSVAVPDVTGRTSAPRMLHAEDVGFLPLDVGGTHVDDARQVEERAHGCGGDAVHAGAGLGDDAALAHAAREQNLAHRVVDLVRAGVVQILALQIDLRAAAMAREPLGEIERARPADIMFEIAAHLAREFGIAPRLVIGALDLEHERHQRLGDEAAAIGAEHAALVGAAAKGVGCRHRRCSSAPARAAQSAARCGIASAAKWRMARSATSTGMVEGTIWSDALSSPPTSFA